MVNFGRFNRGSEGISQQIEEQRREALEAQAERTAEAAQAQLEAQKQLAAKSQRFERGAPVKQGEIMTVNGKQYKSITPDRSWQAEQARKAAAEAAAKQAATSLKTVKQNTAVYNGLTNSNQSTTQYDIADSVASIYSQAKSYGVSQYQGTTLFGSEAEAQAAIDSYLSTANKGLQSYYDSQPITILDSLGREQKVTKSQYSQMEKAQKTADQYSNYSILPEEVANSNSNWFINSKGLYEWTPVTEGDKAELAKENKQRRQFHQSEKTTLTTGAVWSDSFQKDWYSTGGGNRGKGASGVKLLDSKGSIKQTYNYSTINKAPVGSGDIKLSEIKLSSPINNSASALTNTAQQKKATVMPPVIKKKAEVTQSLIKPLTSTPDAFNLDKLFSGGLTDVTAGKQQSVNPFVGKAPGWSVLTGSKEADAKAEKLRQINEYEKGGALQKALGEVYKSTMNTDRLTKSTGTEAFKQGWNLGTTGQSNLSGLATPSSSVSKFSSDLMKKGEAFSASFDAKQDALFGNSKLGNFAKGVTNVPQMLIETAYTAPTGLEGMVRNPGSIKDALLYGAGATAGAAITKAKNNPSEFVGELAGMAALGKVGGKALKTKEVVKTKSLVTEIEKVPVTERQFTVLKGLEKTDIQTLGSEPRSYTKLKTEVISEADMTPSGLKIALEQSKQPVRTFDVSYSKTISETQSGLFKGTGTETVSARGKGQISLSTPEILNGEVKTLSGDMIVQTTKGKAKIDTSGLNTKFDMRKQYDIETFTGTKEIDYEIPAIVDSTRMRVLSETTEIPKKAPVLPENAAKFFDVPTAPTQLNILDFNKGAKLGAPGETHVFRRTENLLPGEKPGWFAVDINKGEGFIKGGSRRLTSDELIKVNSKPIKSDARKLTEITGSNGHGKQQPGLISELNGKGKTRTEALPRNNNIILREEKPITRFVEKSKTKEVVKETIKETPLKFGASGLVGGTLLSNLPSRRPQSLSRGNMINSPLQLAGNYRVTSMMPPTGITGDFKGLTGNVAPVNSMQTSFSANNRVKPIILSINKTRPDIPVHPGLKDITKIQPIVKPEVLPNIPVLPEIAVRTDLIINPLVIPDTKQKVVRDTKTDKNDPRPPSVIPPFISSAKPKLPFDLDLLSKKRVTRSSNSGFGANMKHHYVKDPFEFVLGKKNKRK